MNDIPITDVLDKLWVSYRWDVIYQDWKPTGGWKINTRWNFVNDFSKDRPKWWPVQFVMMYKWLLSFISNILLSMKVLVVFMINKSIMLYI